MCLSIHYTSAAVCCCGAGRRLARATPPGSAAASVTSNRNFASRSLRHAAVSLASQLKLCVKKSPVGRKIARQRPGPRRLPCTTQQQQAARTTNLNNEASRAKGAALRHDGDAEGMAHRHASAVRDQKGASPPPLPADRAHCRPLRRLRHLRCRSRRRRRSQAAPAAACPPPCRRCCSAR